MALQKILRSTTAKLNDVNDTLPGENTAGQTGVSPYSGQLGDVVEIGPDQIKYDSAVGTLYGGWYQYVKVSATHTATPAVGQLAFWVVPTSSILEDTYTVSADAKPTTAIPTLFAGVFLNAITPGNYGFIQIAGRASVLFDSAITAAAAGNWVTAKVSASVASTADVGAAAGVVTLAAMIGIAETLPVVSTISVVQMVPRYLRI